MKISEVHEKVYKFLFDKHKENPSLKFTTRTRNNRDRLKKGYWFIGGEDYLELSFWQGKDSLAKINNIGFTVLLRNSRKEVYYNFSCKDGQGSDVIEKLTNQFNMVKFGNPTNNYWEKTLVSYLYDIDQVIKALDNFINNEKIIIDKLIEQNQDKSIDFISDENFEKYISKIEEYRNSK